VSAGASDGAELKFRDPGRRNELTNGASTPGCSRSAARRSRSCMCAATHEQAIARFGLRAGLQPALHVIMALAVGVA